MPLDGRAYAMMASISATVEAATMAMHRSNQLMIRTSFASCGPQTKYSRKQDHLI